MQRQQPPGYEEFGRIVGKVFVWGVVATLGMVVLLYWLTPEEYRLAERYQVSKDRVIIEPKPHGCDFGDAPLGNKHCHYEKETNVQRACPGPDCRAVAVYVSWRKVEE